jgi:hypothetical protein
MQSQARFTLQGIIMPACIIIILFYIIANFHSNLFSLLNGVPGVTILSAGAILVMKLLFYTKLDDSEIRKFWALLLGILCLLLGECLYFYQQAFLQITVPYPSVADGPYLLANLFISYFLLSSLFSLKNRKGLSSTSIILGISVGSLPLFLAFYSVYSIDVSEPSSRYVSFIDVLYYVLDGLMICPALVILFNLKKNDIFIVHWLLIIVAIIVIVFADVGYTYFSLINESLFAEIEWIWSIFYAIAYLFLAIGIYWFDRIKTVLEDKKINTFLKKDEMDRLKDSSKNEINRDGSEYSEHIVGYQNFVNKLETFLQKSKQIKILFYDKYWLTDEKVNVILDKIQQKAIATNMQVNILIPISQINFKSFLPYGNNRNIFISFFDRNFSSDSLVFIFEEKYVAILDRKPASENIDNNTAFYGLITNKDTLVWSHIATFEKVWLLEKALNM